MNEDKNVIAYYTKNEKGRDFVCGDIHGCFDELENALESIDFNKECDRMFCVGDLIDRGPRSYDALKYYYKDWFYTVQGNHENMFSTHFARYNKTYIHYDFENGTEWSRKQSYEYLCELWEATHNLPLIIKVDDTLILHARLPRKVDNLEIIEANPQKYRETILWERDGVPAKIRIPEIKRVYCGHSIVKKPFEYNASINIDTGAFLTHWGKAGKLTIVDLQDGSFVY